MFIQWKKRVSRKAAKAQPRNAEEEVMGKEGDEEIVDWRLRIEEVIGHGSLVIGDPIVLLGFLQPFERPPPESTNDDSCGHILISG